MWASSFVFHSSEKRQTTNDRGGNSKELFDPLYIYESGSEPLFLGNMISGCSLFHERFDN